MRRFRRPSASREGRADDRAVELDGQGNGLAEQMARLEKRLDELASRPAVSPEQLAAEVHQRVASLADRAGAALAEASATWAERLEELQAELTDTRERLAALTSTSGDNYRKHAGSIDVLRRNQKAGDDRLGSLEADLRTGIEGIHRVLGEQTNRLNAAGERLDALDAAFRANAEAVEQDQEHVEQRFRDAATAADAARALTEERLAELAARATRAEEALRETTRRLVEFDTARTELAAALEGLADDARDSRQRLDDARREWDERFGLAVTDLRAGQAGIIERAHGLERGLADQAERIESLVGRMARTDDELAVTTAGLARVEDHHRALDDRLTAAMERLAPLEHLPATVDGLVGAVASFDDRLLAAETLLNQREDLELLLERTEEVERMAAELDPDRYASRAEVEELRRQLGTGSENALHPTTERD